MKKTLLILSFFAMIFAQEDGAFIPDEMTDSLVVNDTLFSIEEIVENTEITGTTVEPSTGESEIIPEILLSVNEETQIIAFDFQQNCKGKVIEIVNLVGDLIFEVSAATEENSVSFSFKDFEKGIYIVRILAPETRRSVFSKAIVIG